MIFLQSWVPYNKNMTWVPRVQTMYHPRPFWNQNRSIQSKSGISKAVRKFHPFQNAFQANTYKSWKFNCAEIRLSKGLVKSLIFEHSAVINDDEWIIPQNPHLSKLETVTWKIYGHHPSIGSFNFPFLRQLPYEIQNSCWLGASLSSSKKKIGFLLRWVSFTSASFMGFTSVSLRKFKKTITFIHHLNWKNLTPKLKYYSKIKTSY